MTDITDFGLATVKMEGACTDYSSGKETPMVNHNPSETRWIELCYDPEEDMSCIDIESIFSRIDKEIKDSNYTDDEVYLIIKSIANRYVKD